jgi:membrane-bound lytic murein transglycosylase F
MVYREQEQKDAIRQIRERGYLIALTDRNTLNYFVYRGEPMGYQLELLQSFAKYLGVPLKIIASNDLSRLWYYLDYNAADLIALNLPVTRHGKDMVQFSKPFGETRMVLVRKKQSGSKDSSGLFITSLSDFPADTVYYTKSAFMEPIIEVFTKETGKRAIMNEVSNVSQEELIRRVSAGTIRYALCQENVAMVCKRFYTNIDASILAFPLFSYAWGVRHNSDTLLMKINDWLSGIRASGELKKTYLNYFDNQRVAGFFRSEYFSVTGRRLSPYDKEIRDLSKLVWWDWRLLASLVYEESNFRTGLVSSRNASGLMQLMPETAAKFGVDTLSGPAHQLAAGIKYVRYLDQQLPDEISDPRERIHFVLASYNVGIGRVLTAREKAGEFGRDKNRWNGHVDYYLLRRSKKDPHGSQDTLTAFPVDYKTEGFVDDIVNRYYHYRNLIPE